MVDERVDCADEAGTPLHASAPVQAGDTIVLVGAMIPYSVRDSDAFFNLGFALAAVQLAPGGVYIAMNGELFDWDNVRKNYEEGCFESLSDD